MKKSILILLILSSILSASVFICEGKNILATIETNGDYEIKVNINGKKYDGVWKGSTKDKKGKPVKLHYLYSKDNIWIHSQNRFHSDMDNMYLKYLDCKLK